MNPTTQVTSPSGIRLELNANGSIRRIDHADVMINLSLGNEAESRYEPTTWVTS